MTDRVWGEAALKKRATGQATTWPLGRVLEDSQAYIGHACRLLTAHVELDLP